MGGDDLLFSGVSKPTKQDLQKGELPLVSLLHVRAEMAALFELGVAKAAGPFAVPNHEFALCGPLMDVKRIPVTRHRDDVKVSVFSAISTTPPW